MNVARTALAAATLGLAACSTPAATTIIMSQSPSAHPAQSSAKPAPTVTKTEYRTAPVTQPASTATAPAPVAPASSAPASAAPSAAPPSAVPNVTDPWAVVAAYYGDMAATNDCTGAVQDFTGTDTVVGGKIVAANVSQTG
jgi:hypothetical protein